MASYLVTGVSRGIGFEFLRQLSANSANTIIGTVRDRTATEKRISEELQGRKNIHLVEADMTNYAALKKVVDFTAEVTGGSLDYIIANAGLISDWSAYLPIGALGKEPEKLEQDLLQLFKVNVVGQIHLFNLAMPLIMKGKVKKIIAISSGFGIADLVRQYNLHNAAPYCISKAALNMAVAQFSAQYSKDGVLVISVSPGTVDTGHWDNASDEEKILAGEMMGKFMQYAPDFKGLTGVDVSVGQMLSVIEKASVEGGDGGTSVSQFGNQQWL